MIVYSGGFLLSENKVQESIIFEHKFWLQIMGDHGRFIYDALPTQEEGLLSTCKMMITKYDHYLDLIYGKHSPHELDTLNKEIYELNYSFRDLKLLVLSKTLTAELIIRLSSSFLNDTINELDEYLYIMHQHMEGNIPDSDPIHYHMLWLTDALGHANVIGSELDYIEHDYILKARQFEVQFDDLVMKTIFMNGYLRTQLKNFPAMERLNNLSANTINEFLVFVEMIRDQRMDGKLLGSIFPLMADHMAREACYYLLKLSATTPNIYNPKCDPTRPRMSNTQSNNLNILRDLPSN